MCLLCPLLGSFPLFHLHSVPQCRRSWGNLPDNNISGPYSWSGTVCTSRPLRAKWCAAPQYSISQTDRMLIVWPLKWDLFWNSSDFVDGEMELHREISISHIIGLWEPSATTLWSKKGHYLFFKFMPLHGYFDNDPYWSLALQLVIFRSLLGFNFFSPASRLYLMTYFNFILSLIMSIFGLLPPNSCRTP